MVRACALTRSSGCILARLEGVTLRHFRREFPGMMRISTRPKSGTPPAQPVTVNVQPLLA